MAEDIKTLDDQSKSNYCCVTCGTEADELSHHYKEGVIKIIHCVREMMHTEIIYIYFFKLNSRNNVKILLILILNWMIYLYLLILFYLNYELIDMFYLILIKLNIPYEIFSMIFC